MILSCQKAQNSFGFSYTRHPPESAVAQSSMAAIWLLYNFLFLDYHCQIQKMCNFLDFEDFFSFVHESQDMTDL